MPVCSVCGHDRHRSLERTLDGPDGGVAPPEHGHYISQNVGAVCAHCGVRIFGHGFEVGRHFFGCAHCSGVHAEGQRWTGR